MTSHQAKAYSSSLSNCQSSKRADSAQVTRPQVRTGARMSTITTSSRRVAWLLVLLLEALALASVGESSLSDAQPAAPATSTAAQFCQPQTVGQRVQSANQQAADWTKKIFCFYDIQDDFRPQDLNPCLCTHVVYSYVAVRKNLSFIAGKKGDLRSLASLKRKNPNLKLLVSLRPDDYFSFEPSDAFSSSPPDTRQSSSALNSTAPIQMNEMHQKFAKRIRDFIVRHSLDGINLDWPYFAQTMASTGAAKDHLTLVLAAINENFQTTLAQSSPSSAYLRLQSPIVTLTASKDYYSITEGYDFHQINKLLDYVHLPAFDFDLNVDQYSIGHPARLHGISDAENLDTLVDLLLSSGLPSDQLIAGIPSHGVQITSRPVSHQPANTSAEPTSSTVAPSSMDEQLEAAANISIISHSEVCRVRDSAGNNCSSIAAKSTPCWTMSRARDLTAPFAYDSEHWIGFDDETSVKLKAKYVLLRHLAGVSMFTVNNDDPAGTCGFGPFPLLATINGVFARAPQISHPQQQQQPQRNSAGSDQQQASASNQRSYFTRAPNQILTATSLVSQIFGKKVASSDTAATTPTPIGDLMQSGSDERQERIQAPASMSPSSSSSGLMSFVDIIEKYGSVNRLDAASGQGQQDSNQRFDPEVVGKQLPCERVGYQRYPRDCSRFYRCVQTPPATSTPITALATQADQPTSGSIPSVTTTSVTRLQYECPSGLVFDEQYQICNWPSWSAQCSGSGEVNAITNAKFVCPSYGYFQNQENCEYFYYCSGYNKEKSQAYQFRCPFELGFDEEKLQCNWKWLVSGCNATSSISNSSAPFSELAQEYLAKLANTTTESSSAPTTTVAPDSERLVSSSAEEKPSQISKRSLDLSSEARGIPQLTSHMTSLLASIEAIRQYRMKKSGTQQSSADKLASDINSRIQQAASGASSGRYPLFVGTPPTEAPTSTSSNKKSTFRSRRRQASVATSSNSETSGGLPYRRRPAPPSIFSFLPNSALYMVVDSFRSYGEAIQGEVNRIMRIAGDRMRGWLGPRPLKGNERSDDASKLQTLLSRLGPGNSFKVSTGAAIDPDGRRKRAKRDTSNDGYVMGEPGDLEALESAPGGHGGYQMMAALSRPQPMQVRNYQQQQQYRDPLGRPPGYPLNPLDDAAKSAVLGPEPKLYSQPSALVSNQVSGISQAEYERLIGSNREALNMYANHMVPNQHPPQRPHHNNARGPMMAAASSNNEQVVFLPGAIDQAKVIERVLEQARGPAYDSESQSSPAPQQVPFGMPTTVRQVNRQPVEIAPAFDEVSLNGKKRRSTVAMKLATLAMPRFSLAPTRPPTTTPSVPASSPKASTSTTRGYMSFLPNFSHVVVAPARNIMNKVQDLISTLSPGNKQQEHQQHYEHFRPPQTTPMPYRPIPLRNFQQQQQQQQFHHHQQIQFQQQQNHFQQHPLALQQMPNKTAAPLLLTEQEARALSAQLDQLSKEQLEALSEVFAKSERPQNDKAEESQDYVVRLLKMLSKTSHNPEDIKLLDQLASQVNSPQAQPQSGDSMIEIGQPDDLALLEALGLIPAPSPVSGPADKDKYTVLSESGPTSNETVTEEDNRPEASYDNYSHRGKHLMMVQNSAKPPMKHYQPPQIVQHMDQMRLVSDLGTTQLVPVTLELHENTTPNYNYPPQRYSDYMSTSASTTTQRPEILTRVIEEQTIERPAPPVKQTFVELIETNTTTPDGIETISETRTKTAVSNGASFNIGSQVGLGMIPPMFGGSVSSDSLHAAASGLKSSSANSVSLESSKNLTVIEAGASNSTTSGSQKASLASTAGASELDATEPKKLSESSAIKGGRLTAGLEFSQGTAPTSTTGQFDQNWQKFSGANQANSGQYLDSGSSFSSGARTISSIGDSQFGGSNAGRIVSQSTQRSFAPPRTSGSATLSQYNFATQPVDQFEEVVVKKRFKPFPKQVLMPQEMQYTVEEVQQQVTPGPAVQTTFADSFDMNQPQQSPQQHFQFQQAAGGAQGGLNSGPFSATASLQSVTEQVKEGDFATGANTFGENANQAGGGATSKTESFSRQPDAASSLTRQELEQQGLAQDFQKLTSILEQQQQLNLQRERLSNNQNGRFAFTNGLSSEQIANGAGDTLAPLTDAGSRLQAPLTLANGTVGEVSDVSVTGGELASVGKASKRRKSKASKAKRLRTSSTTTSEQKEAKSTRSTTEAAEGSESNSTVTTPSARVETAFSNFMVELKRSRKSNSETVTTTTEAPTTTRSERNTDESADESQQSKKKRKSRSKGDRRPKQPTGVTASGSSRDEKVSPLEGDSLEEPTSERQSTRQRSRSSSRRKTSRNSTKSASSSSKRPRSSKGRQTKGTAEEQFIPADPIVKPVGTEQVAVYGTKSGFMPIIRPDDPSYSSTRLAPSGASNQVSTNWLPSGQNDPLSLSASYISSKQSTPREQSAGGAKPVDNPAKDVSWRNFVRKLSDQISVVNLGNYSEEYSLRQVPVKLVILPASPNNLLLEPQNWNYLSSYYPQLFPPNLADLNVGPIDLGDSSIAATSGTIDVNQEERRHGEFRRQFEPISGLIEQQTFKALDEIVQRSSGRLFLMQRKDMRRDPSRTMIAVIPDRPLIRQVIVPAAASEQQYYQRHVDLQQQQQQHNQQISTTQNYPTTASSTTSTSTPIGEPDLQRQTPQKAATFSRAIQESIQGAIRQHYDSLKTQIKQSMAGSENPETTTDPRDAERQWSTPAADTLAKLSEAPVSSSSRGHVDPMEAASSSTEYSIGRMSSNETYTTTTAGRSAFASHSVYEVEGAEPKSLYGIDLNSQKVDQRQYFKDESQNITTTMPTLVTKQLNASKPVDTRHRFMSIGSHLMASPMKLPKVVDQAYVNHFYDHIGDHQLAKAIAFDDNQSATSEQQTGKPELQFPTTAMGEDSLVPESACTRAGLFQHPFACNKFYECFWDKQLNRFTLHMFECPIKLAFDDRIVGCAMPIESSLCVNY